MSLYMIIDATVKDTEKYRLSSNEYKAIEPLREVGADARAILVDGYRE